MITTILTFHLAMAALYVLTVSIVGLASIAKRAVPSVVKVAYGSFGAIIVSGIGLVAVSPKTMAHFCVSALVCTAFGIVIAQVYKYRVVAFHGV